MDIIKNYQNYLYKLYTLYNSLLFLSLSFSRNLLPDLLTRSFSQDPLPFQYPLAALSPTTFSFVLLHVSYPGSSCHLLLLVPVRYSPAHPVPLPGRLRPGLRLLPGGHR